MLSTCTSSLRKSSTPRIDRASSWSKNVVLVVTRKPRALAAAMAAMALSNTPVRHTDSSWRSRRPSICIENEKYGDGGGRGTAARGVVSIDQVRTPGRAGSGRYQGIQTMLAHHRVDAFGA